MYEYENVYRIIYDENDECGRATFVPVCEKCHRFVKANETIRINANGLADEPNAICSKCGPTKMLFEGFI